MLGVTKEGLNYQPQAGYVPRHLLVVYNPTAGQRQLRSFSRILDRLRSFGCKITLYETKAPGDAELFVRGITVSDYDAVVAAGGDGTIREVVSGLAGRALPLGVVPLGTANVLATEIGLSRDELSLSEVIALGCPKPVYTGEANGCLFLLMAGVGFDARVVEGVNIGLKRAVGKMAYVTSTFSALVRNRPSSYVVEIDGSRFTAAAVIIAKSRHYGGKFVIADLAQLDKPSLQVALFTKGRRRDLMQYAAALAAGRMHKLRNVRILPAREVRVAGCAGERIHLDGDLVVSLPVFAKVNSQPLLLLH